MVAEKTSSPSPPFNSFSCEVKCTGVIICAQVVETTIITNSVMIIFFIFRYKGTQKL